MQLKITIVALLLSITTFSFGQSSKYHEIMQKNIELLNQENTKESYQQIANTFERIAKAEKTEWQPYYYAAYALVMNSYNEQDLNKVDPVLNKADELIAIAESLQPEHSDITTVKAMIMQSRMRGDNNLAMTLGPKSSELLQKAMAQKPANNPRAMMNMAQTLYYTPEAFGGSKQKAFVLLQKALQMYEVFKPETPLDPTWGKEYVASLVKQWQPK